MKIVHIATTRHGGAGRAAWRQHMALLQSGVESWFLSNDPMPVFPESNWVTVQTKSNSVLRRLIENRFFGKGYYSDNKSVHSWSRRIWQATVELDAEMYSLPFSHWLLHKHPLVKKASIVNLHWVAGILDYPSFFDGIKKPIVWTLHDMQPFSGIFHYENDYSNNLRVKSIDEDFRMIKANSIHQRTSSLSFVAPSSWMLNKALESLVFSGLDGWVVPYSIDLSVFKPKDRNACKKRLGLPIDKKLLLFISHHTETPRKGFSILQAALNNLAVKNREWGLISVGESNKKDTSKFPTYYCGIVSSDELLADYYGAADIVVMPSLEDNLPNVLLEAFACGRPVISFKNGGMAEHIEHGVNGWVGAPYDLTTLLAEAMNNFKKCEVPKIRDYAENMFSAKKQAQAYTHLYKTLLER